MTFFGNFDDQVRYFVALKSDFVSNLIKMLKSQLNSVMEKLESYKEQINKVKNLIDKLEQGVLSVSELTELESTTRALHEKSIILKYKAFEGSIKTEEIEAPVEETSVQEVEEEEQVESASPFDWNPMSETPEIEEKEEIAEPIIELTEEEMKVETPPSIQDIMNDLTKEDISDVVEVLTEEEPEIVEETPEETIDESPEEEVEEDIPAPSNESNGTFIDQLNLADASTHSLTMGSKIDSLIGAFGLNEKLRFINDLFDGSSEAFNNAVKTLDTQSGLGDANATINSLSNEHSWDVEDETAGEFVSFVNRRYA